MARDAGKLLVIARGPIGPFVLALAAMRHIRAAHPLARISLLTTPPFAGLARACPYLDMVDIDGEPEGFGVWAALVGRLRAARYDRIYDLEGSPWTGRLFRGLWPFPPQWSGEAVGCALPHRNPSRHEMHPLERQADQLKAAGIWPDAPTGPGAAPPPDVSWITRRTLQPRAPARPHVLLAPGAAAESAQARWPARFHAEVAQRLRTQGYDILVVGGPEDRGLAQQIQQRVAVRDMTGAADFAQVAALATRATLAIGADTGLTHLVAAAGAPTLALFPKASDPARHGPRGHVAVLQADSLDELSVDEVMWAVQRLAPLNQMSV